MSRFCHTAARFNRQPAPHRMWARGSVACGCKQGEECHPNPPHHHIPQEGGSRTGAGWERRLLVGRWTPRRRRRRRREKQQALDTELLVGRWTPRRRREKQQAPRREKQQAPRREKQQAPRREKQQALFDTERASGWATEGTACAARRRAWARRPTQLNPTGLQRACPLLPPASSRRTAWPVVPHSHPSPRPSIHTVVSVLSLSAMLLSALSLSQ
jgi:hypothetical protein